MTDKGIMSSNCITLLPGKMQPKVALERMKEVARNRLRSLPSFICKTK